MIIYQAKKYKKVQNNKNLINNNQQKLHKI